MARKMGILLFGMLLFVTPGSKAWAIDNQVYEAGVVVGSTVVMASLARAEEALVRSMVNYNQLRGVFGEKLMEQVVLREGGWHAVSTSPKPQGIDGIYIKHDRLGRPRGLIVAEAKFGTSRLSTDKTGNQQMSPNWIADSRRLAYEASRYKNAASATLVDHRPRPRNATEKLDTVRVTLPNGQEAYFWREGGKGRWFYDGPEGSLEAAQKAALRDANYLEGAALGRIEYRARVYTVTVQGNTLKVKVQDVDPVSNKAVRLRTVATVTLDQQSGHKQIKQIREEIASQLVNKNPNLTMKEARTLADSVIDKTVQETITKQTESYPKAAIAGIGKAALKTTLIAAAMNIGEQLLSNGKVDIDQLVNSLVTSSLSSTAGTAARYALVRTVITSPKGIQLFHTFGQKIGVPSGVKMTGMVSNTVAGAIAFLTLTAIMMTSGHIDLQDVVSMVPVSGVSALAGIGAETGLMMIATTFGKASTGVAISSLHGIAATKAALAWLGGSVATGTLLLGGSVVVAGAAVAMIASWAMTKYQEHEMNKRQEIKAKLLINNSEFLREACGARVARSNAFTRRDGI
jgi:hypothetical protein